MEKRRTAAADAGASAFPRTCRITRWPSRCSGPRISRTCFVHLGSAICGHHGPEKSRGGIRGRPAHPGAVQGRAEIRGASGRVGRAVDPQAGRERLQRAAAAQGYIQDAAGRIRNQSARKATAVPDRPSGPISPGSTSPPQRAEDHGAAGRRKVLQPVARPRIGRVPGRIQGRPRVCRSHRAGSRANNAPILAHQGSVEVVLAAVGGD